jgi:sugar transport system substrate-binding protein
MVMKKRFGMAIGVLAVVVGVVVVVLASCSKPDEGGAGGGGAGTQVRMAGIVFQEDQFFRLIQAGMHEAAGRHNVELLDGNSDNHPDKEFELVNTYTTQRVDAILISPLSAKGSVASLQQAHDKGIKVITNNTTIDADFPDGSIVCSNEDLGSQTGKACRKYIEEELGGKATVAILAFKSQEPEQSDARVGGFTKELEGMAGVKIVAQQDAWLSEMAVSKGGDILTANPDVDVIYAANELPTDGAVLAVKNAGKAGKIAVFGTDVSEHLLTFLQSDDNILQAITAQRPFDIGVQSVEMALKAIKGEPYEKRVVLKGVCLSRADMEGVRAYAKQFKEWTSK